MLTRHGHQRARAALVGGALVVLTLAGHAAGSAALPAGPGVPLVLVLAAALAMAVTQRPPRLVPLLAALLGAQALLHLVLTFTASHGHAAGATAPHAAVMVLGHVVAAAVAAAVIVQADGLIDRWGRFVSTLLGDRPLSLCAPAAGPSSRTALQPVARPASFLLLHQVIRRGPPAPALLT